MAFCGLNIEKNRDRTKSSCSFKAQTSRRRPRSDGSRPPAGRSRHRLWSPEPSAEGVPGNRVRRTEVESLLQGAAEARGERNEGEAREVQKIRAGCRADRAVVEAAVPAGLELMKES